MFGRCSLVTYEHPPPPRPHSLEQRVILSRYFVTLQVQNHNKTLF